ncbi:MAG: organoarsenical effux MFS transporter ArsJ, partial [Rhodospirillaceae bacterium]|nr:organoarsenical effux MFS transporter ArsJ [Rhodospirillaceae bacterium]
MNSGVRNYILVTAAYWGFTLTDGALRMLVLLHFYGLGYSPFQIAQLFLFYEVFGIVTNLVGGWIGARLGLKVTLFAGLGLQVVALAALSRFNSDWPIVMGVAYVMGSQALSGIAKDLTKLSAKSAIKVLVTDGNHGALFKWVAALTGSKNALKGLGFFLGGFLLSWLGFSVALITMAACLGAILLAAVVSLPGNIGQTKAKVRFGDVFSKSAKINWLSGARFFLFGARDIWFVVGLPLFLAGSLGWDHPQVGAYMALWVIAYGLVQAATPKLLRQSGAAPTGG